jgi:hypothetical protein
LARFSNKLLKKVEQVIIRTGMDIAPKSFEKNVIGSDGKLTSTQTKVYGKKIPLKDIIQSETKRLHAAGILNIYSDDHYTSLSLQPGSHGPNRSINPLDVKFAALSADNLAS